MIEVFIFIVFLIAYSATIIISKTIVDGIKNILKKRGKNYGQKFKETYRKVSWRYTEVIQNKSYVESLQSQHSQKW